ncbi:MAG: SHOCT domain-containing protein [Candidatus Nanopelagicales bacterium]
MPIRRRPVLRTAAVVGTATAVNRKVNEKYDDKEQAQQQAAQQAPPADVPPTAAPAAAPEANAAGDELIEQLSKLASLKDAGALTEEEFTAAKAKLLG